jgi:putative Ig domain-containing protein
MRALAFASLSCSLALVSCTDDLDAPYNYQPATDSDSSVDTGDGLLVDCSALAQAAVGASYSRTITATGGEAPYEFAATPLPAGLVIDASTGTVTGTPTQSGAVTVMVTVTDATADTVSESCELEVAGQLAVEPLAIDTVPYCLTGADTLRDLVVEGTGDGTPITCDTPGGNGNGKLPAGVSIGAETCAPVGTITDTRLGTWAFMVRGTQSGAEVLVPYCVTNDTPATGTFEIEVEHSGAADRELVPLTRTFNPDGSLLVGGQDDPRFEITGDACATNFCSYGYNFFIDASPFDANTLSLGPEGLLQDDADQPIGFFHNLSISGPVVPDAFKRRPWVVNVDLDYCISADADECDNAVIPDNANGFLQFSIIMVPQPS